MSRSYEVQPRPTELGGGWRLYLFEVGEEAGGGVYPPGDETYADAIAEGEAWAAACH